MYHLSSAPPSRINRLSQEGWERYRNAITDLYVGQNWPLPKVRQHMREHYQLHLSEKMYKSQFTLWKLEKNMTKNRALRFGEKHIGPSSNLSSAVDFSDDSKKLRKYSHRLPEMEKGRFLQEILKNSTAENTLSKMSPPLSLLPPERFLLPERYFYLLNSYVSISLEFGNWPKDNQDGLRNEDIVPAWCSSIMSATWVLAEGKVAEAFRFLHHFIDESPAHLSREDPRLFPFLYSSILSFAQHHPAISKWLINSLCAEWENLLLTRANSSHPLRLLLQLMLRLKPDEIVSHASNILLAYINIIQDALGATYPIIQDMMSDTIWRLNHHNLVSTEEVVSLGRRALIKAELENQDRCKDYLNLKMNLAGAYLKLGNLHDARLTTTEVLNTQAKVANSERMLPSLHMNIGRIEEAAGNFEDAILSVVRAVVSSIEIFGEYSDWTLNCLIMYRQVLERAGRLTEAQRIIEDRDLTIEILSRRIGEPVTV